MKIKISILVILFSVSQLVYSQQPKVSFSSGRLFVDPTTLEEINSPYLSLLLRGQQQWIAYDPEVKEGRFVSVASSPAVAVTCGYIKGTFNFLGKRIEADENKYTGIVVGVSPNKKLLWSHKLEKDLVNSKFSSAVCLKGSALSVVSGYFFDEENSNSQAVLICFNRSGEILWKKEITEAKGYEIKQNTKGEIFWHVAMEKGGDQYSSSIFKVDSKNGTTLFTIEEEGLLQPIGIKGAMTFDFTANHELITARTIIESKNVLRLNKYNENGQLLWTNNLVEYSGNPESILPQGVVEDINGQFRLATNLTDRVFLPENNIELIPAGSSDILLFNLNSKGTLIGHEQYGEKFASTAGFFKTGNRVGLIGAYKENLKIQDNSLSYSKNRGYPQGYNLLLKEFALKVDVELPQSLKENKTPFAIFPNPSENGIINIQNEIVDTENYYTIKIYDSAGNLKLSKGKLPKSTSIQDQISVHDLATGLYLVIFYQNNQILNS
ncbi:T9SS type A sorting domain-containing protein, partial [Xanthovirga aplysinae]|uniref:T9SS type A sorting domain-containing protein n=1 Tax=Xanthovirga aplysinae TaxID=2529853 RepID=UPI0012BB7227